MPADTLIIRIRAAEAQHSCRYLISLECLSNGAARGQRKFDPVPLKMVVGSKNDETDESDKEFWTEVGRLNHWRPALSENDSSHEELAKRVGRHLFNRLFTGSPEQRAMSHFLASIVNRTGPGRVHGSGSSSVATLRARTRIILEVTDDLLHLPWELLYLPTNDPANEDDGVFVARAHPFIRRLNPSSPVGEAKFPPLVKLERMVGCHVSSSVWPCGRPSFRPALIRWSTDARPANIDWCTDATLEQLEVLLTNRNGLHPIYLHVGHAFSDPKRHRSGMLFAKRPSTGGGVNAEPSLDLVESPRLAKVLSEKNTAAAILIGSLTGRIPRLDHDQRLNDTLVGQLSLKVPCILGIQHEMSSSSCFSFLGHLMNIETDMAANPVGIEVAVLRARQQMYTSSMEPLDRVYRPYAEVARVRSEWWKPVLYVDRPDARLEFPLVSAGVNLPKPQERAFATSRNDRPSWLQ